MSKCQNHIICANTVDADKQICFDCNMLFGKWRGNNRILNIIENIKCPLCLRMNTCISRPSCEHFICVDCFKKIYFSKSNYIIKDYDLLSEYLEFENMCKKCFECDMSNLKS